MSAAEGRLGFDEFGVRRGGMRRIVHAVEQDASQPCSKDHAFFQSACEQRALQANGGLPVGNETRRMAIRRVGYFQVAEFSPRQSEKHDRGIHLIQALTRRPRFP